MQYRIPDMISFWLVMNRTEMEVFRFKRVEVDDGCSFNEKSQSPTMNGKKFKVYQSNQIAQKTGDCSLKPTRGEDIDQSP